MLHPNDILKSVEDGHRTNLSAAVLLKRMIESATAAYDEVKYRAHDELERQGVDEMEVEGATVKKYGGKTTYDYDDVPAVIVAKRALAQKQDDAKMAYKLISSNKVPVQDGCAIIDGELVKPCKATFSQPSVSIRL